MWWSIPLFLFLAFLYMLQSRYYKEIYQEILLYIGMGLLTVNFFSRSTNAEPFDANESLFALLIVFVLTFFYYKFSKNEKPKIVANQNTFWNVDPSTLIEQNKHLIVKKKGRNELTTQTEEYYYEEVYETVEVDGKEKLEKVRKLAPIILSDIKNYRGFTVIQSLDYFESQEVSKLHGILFKKLKEISEDKEIEIDFEQLLIDDKYCVEFFLIDSWEILCSKEIIGIGTLNAYAVNKKELELIGALDASTSSNVTKTGILLYSHYLNFKGLKG